MAIGAGKTESPAVNYVEERELQDGELEFPGPRTDELVVRDWDVSDSEARRVAAEEQLGEGVDDDHWYAQHAQWFINPTLNAAVLIVYRPKVAA